MLANPYLTLTNPNLTLLFRWFIPGIPLYHDSRHDGRRGRGMHQNNLLQPFEPVARREGTRCNDDGGVSNPFDFFAAIKIDL